MQYVARFRTVWIPTVSVDSAIISPIFLKYRRTHLFFLHFNVQRNIPYQAFEHLSTLKIFHFRKENKKKVLFKYMTNKLKR
jgi:hypothetical protein